MKCQVCGTMDNKDGRGPVKIHGGEGVCSACDFWLFRIELKIRRARR